MQEIKCPKCGESFTVDESGYAAILKQVRDSEFDKGLSRREAVFDSEMKNAVELAVAKTQAQNDKVIAELHAKIEAENAKKILKRRKQHL